MSRLKGQKIVVTGGSRGIGAAIARECASQGAQVALTYSSRQEAAETLVSQLEGDGHFAVKLDISDEQSVQSAFNEMLERLGSVDGLVNNAGITKDKLFLRMSTQDFDDVLNTNMRGSFLCTKAVCKSMMKAKKGSVVYITSVIGQTGNAGQANYAASKAGTEAMAKSLAQELATRGLRFNCVAPGFIESDMTNELTEEQKQAILNQIPQQKIGESQDVAQAVSFLLSEESKYITGQTINVNGGLFMA